MRSPRQITLWSLLALLLLAVALPTPGKDRNTPLNLAKGARVGIVNMLNSEVTQFHTGHVLTQTFLKTYPVTWPVDSMLVEAVRQRLGELGLVVVPVGPSEALIRARDEIFVSNSVVKGLPHQGASEFAQLAANEHLNALIVLAPGLNNSSQAGSAVRHDLPDYLRGWGFVTRIEGGAKPTLFNMTQLLLIEVTPAGATLRAREWGGGYTESWADFTPPADIKQLSSEQLDPLQPLFAHILTQQTRPLLEWLCVTP